MLRRIALTLAAVVLLTGVARAEDKAACVAAADAGQELREKRKLVAAREQFIVCAQDGCPSLVRRDCGQWQLDIEARVPSVVFVARDGQGNDLESVRVLLDGNLVADRLDGSSMHVDPGPHTVVFERSGKSSSSLSVILREGEKNRHLEAVFPADAPRAVTEGPPSSGGGRSLRPNSWVPEILLGTAGLIVAGGAVALGLNGRSDVDGLHDTCAGHCPDADVRDARQKLLFADIGLGIGVVALGFATYLALTRHRDPRAAAP